jgi:hypothetical protein
MPIFITIIIIMKTKKLILINRLKQLDNSINHKIIKIIIKFHSIIIYQVKKIKLIIKIKLRITFLIKIIKI